MLDYKIKNFFHTSQKIIKLLMIFTFLCLSLNFKIKAEDFYHLYHDNYIHLIDDPDHELDFYLCPDPNPNSPICTIDDELLHLFDLNPKADHDHSEDNHFLDEGDINCPSLSCACQPPPCLQEDYYGPYNKIPLRD